MERDGEQKGKKEKKVKEKKAKKEKPEKKGKAKKAEKDPADMLLKPIVVKKMGADDVDAVFVPAGIVGNCAVDLNNGLLNLSENMKLAVSAMLGAYEIKVSETNGRAEFIIAMEAEVKGKMAGVVQVKSDGKLTVISQERYDDDTKIVDQSLIQEAAAATKKLNDAISECKKGKCGIKLECAKGRTSIKLPPKKASRLDRALGALDKAAGKVEVIGGGEANGDESGSEGGEGDGEGGEGGEGGGEGGGAAEMDTTIEPEPQEAAEEEEIEGVNGEAEAEEEEEEEEKEEKDMPVKERFAMNKKKSELIKNALEANTEFNRAGALDGTQTHAPCRAQPFVESRCTLRSTSLNVCAGSVPCQGNAHQDGDAGRARRRVLRDEKAIQRARPVGGRHQLGQVHRGRL